MERVRLDSGPGRAAAGVSTVNVRTEAKLYPDVPFAGTVARHATGPIVADAVDENRLRDWYRPAMCRPTVSGP